MLHPPLSPASLSRLESLPIEILEYIFLYSLEINLPRASPHLGRALSNPLLYTWLIRLVFSSTNASSRHGFFTPDFLPPPLDFWSLGYEQRQHLQTTLLACRWCTLPLLRRCQREYVEHAIRRKCANLVFSAEDQEALRNLGPLFNHLEHCDHAIYGHRGKGDLVLHARLSENHTQSGNSDPDKLEHQSLQSNQEKKRKSKSKSSVDHKLAIWFHFGAVQIRKQNEIYYETDLFRLPCPAANSPGRIPDKIFRSPWSESQFEFLQLLATDFYLDESNVLMDRSAEITSRLIRKRQIEPFLRLLSMWFRSADYRVLGPWPLHSSHFQLIKRYAGFHRDQSLEQEQVETDPFAAAIIHQRWVEIPVELQGDLLRLGRGDPM
ncbi:uncharacterized protein N7483_002177 [Penicillium malachiteum]|uniref:uncharacterized protein n=1 Tax=Penicillium malachiteum TaxID=1324776 RepID=UPI0025471477|nr:uncharacterized protein N7483_002177 [Penicillium malachiteum]KAJ5737052.1 hypothetical protein N7483_002177 [Penicillium malachiteum]